jgi:hypothetical protein
LQGFSLSAIPEIEIQLMEERKMAEVEQPVGAPKKARRRSREHPKIAAGQCVELAGLVRQYGGAMGVEEYAKALGYSSHTTGGVIAKISSPQYFGLFTRDKNQLTATDLLERILVPLEGELEQAKVEAIHNVRIYEELLAAIGPTGVKKYDVVKNIAQRRLGIEEGAADVFVRAFVESMQWAGLGRALDDDSFELVEEATPGERETVKEDEKVPGVLDKPATTGKEPVGREIVGIKAAESLPLQVHLHLNGLTAEEIKDIMQAVIAALREG